MKGRECESGGGTRRRQHGGYQPVLTMRGCSQCCNVDVAEHIHDKQHFVSFCSIRRRTKPNLLHQISSKYIKHSDCEQYAQFDLETAITSSDYSTLPAVSCSGT